MSRLYRTSHRPREAPQVARYEGFDRGFGEPVNDTPVFMPSSSQQESDEEWEPSFLNAFEDESNYSPRARQLIEEARQQKEKTIQDAKAEAGRILDAARKRSEEIEAEAYQKAFEQGEAAGRQLGEQKLDAVVRQLRAAIDDLLGQRDSLLRTNEEEFVKIAFMISLQLIQRELQQDPSVILDVVRASLAKVQRASRLCVYVSPYDFRFLEGHLDLLQGLTETGTPVNIEPEESIHRGGCRVVSDTGEVDATIDRMLENVRSRIWDQD